MYHGNAPVSVLAGQPAHDFGQKLACKGCTDWLAPVIHTDTSMYRWNRPVSVLAGQPAPPNLKILAACLTLRVHTGKNNVQTGWESGHMSACKGCTDWQAPWFILKQVSQENLPVCMQSGQPALQIWALQHATQYHSIAKQPCWLIWASSHICEAHALTQGSFYLR